MEVKRSNAMHLHRGYKQTDIGQLPVDWGVERIHSTAETSSGTTPPRSLYERYYTNGDIAWVKTLDLNNSEIHGTDECVTQAALNETSLRLYPPGSVLVAMYGGFNQIGRTGLLRIPAAVNQAITAIRPKFDRLNPAYLLRVLNFRIGYWRKVASSSRKDPNITSKDVREFPVPLPSIAEQKAIAEALSDADALIKSLEQLLAKKRQIKQGAMQELLTGKRRLPGFGGEWRIERLDEVAALKSGEGITSESIDDHSQFPCYGGNGLRGHTNRFTHDGVFVLIGRQGALCGNVALAEGRFFASEHAIVVSPLKRTDIRWLANVLGNMNLNQYSESSAQPGLSVAKLLSLTMSLPPPEEQTAIAMVLTDLDTELSALGVNLAKARQIKQGMMQELLTGRIRLI